MQDVKDKLIMKYFKAKAKVISMFYDEKGETNIIAIILIIIVVIALAGLFRKQIMDVVNNLFGRVNNNIDSFDNGI